jgi:LAO/AO transport system kinase
MNTGAIAGGPSAASDAAALADAVGRRDRSAVAAALNLLDDRRAEARAAAAELIAFLASSLGGRPAGEGEGRGHVVGITGPPGSGKSSLSAVLIDGWRAAGRTVGVLAVDPSSARTGGALLGDRIRMLRPAVDDGVFVRSLASRGELGGLSPEVWPMSLVMIAAFDVVVVETVGIGQSETDVAELADTTCCVVQPASGDTVQFLKSGIMEVPDVFAVSKADLGVLAERTARELSGAVPRRPEGEWQVPVQLVSATGHTGIEALSASFEAHRTSLVAAGTLATRRRSHQARSVLKRLQQEFGTHGVARLGGADALLHDLVSGTSAPLACHETLRERALSLLGSSGGRHG